MFLTPFPVYRSVWGVSNPRFSNVPCLCPLLTRGKGCFIPTPSRRKKWSNRKITKSQQPKIGHFRSPGVTSGNLTYSNTLPTQSQFLSYRQTWTLHLSSLTILYLLLAMVVSTALPPSAGPSGMRQLTLFRALALSTDTKPIRIVRKQPDFYLY